jgi:hypothetical protein
MIVLWTASRSTLEKPGGAAWLESLARKWLPAPETQPDAPHPTLVTGDASSDDVAWGIACELDLPRARYRKDGAVEGPDGFVRWWLPGAPRPLPSRADRAGWKERLLARDAWMVHDVARAIRERGAEAVCVAAIDPDSPTQGTAFTAARAERARLTVARVPFEGVGVRLRVATARVSYGGEDRLDITRSTATAEGLPFAPSDAILWPAKRELKAADAVERSGDRAAAEAMRAATWAWYEPRYRAEMRAGYGKRTKPGPHRAAWERLLARERVTLVCYCTNPSRCHRTLLSGMLVALGAEPEGERPAQEKQPPAAGGMGRARSPARR